MKGNRREKTFDAVGVEIFNNRVSSIVEEMGANLVRSSFSPNIKERRDCSVALFDATGRAIAQAAHIPIHLGSLKGGVISVLDNFELEQIESGDAFVCNDAYLAGGTHLPDISIITPIFYDREIKFFAACLGHHSDVGGTVPGSISPDASTIFEEGIRIPPIRIVQQHIINDDIMKLIIQNTREPEDRLLDLKVQIATNNLGAIRLNNLIENMGLENLNQAVEDLLAYTDRRTRALISKLKNGEQSFTTWMDDDGLAGEKLPLTATVKVFGDKLELDFTGSGPQSRGAYNIMTTGVMATVAYAIKALLDPELPANEGLFKSISFSAPKGTILNPMFPAAVGARTTTCQKLSGAIFGAFAQLLPIEKTMASCHDVLAGMVFSGKSRKHDGTYVYLETVGGGNGARYNSDGMDGAHCHITNSLNMPVEAVENEYPLLVKEYTLIPNSGGAGEYRGGMGVAREIVILEDGTTFSSRADSYKTSALGHRGGREGGNCRIVLNFDTKEEQVMTPKQRLLTLQTGDSIRMETPGGGGFGKPKDRNQNLLAQDIIDGRITFEIVKKFYGEELLEEVKSLI